MSILESNGANLAAGLVEIRSRVTHAQLAFNFAVLYAGGHNLRAGVCEAHEKFHSFIDEVRLFLSKSGVSSGSSALDNYFGEKTYTLKSLFRDKRKRIVTQIVDNTLTDIDKLYGEVYEHNVSLIDFLRDLALPLPPILRASSEFVLNNEIRRSLCIEKLDCERLRRFVNSVAQKGIALDASVNAALRERLERTMNCWSIDPFEVQTLNELEVLVSLVRAISVEGDLWQAQNTYYELMKMVAPLKLESAGHLSVELFRKVGHSLGIAVPEAVDPSVDKRVIPMQQAAEFELTAAAEG